MLSFDAANNAGFLPLIDVVHGGSPLVLVDLRRPQEIPIKPPVNQEINALKDALANSSDPETERLLVKSRRVAGEVGHAEKADQLWSIGHLRNC